MKAVWMTSLTVLWALFCPAAAQDAKIDWAAHYPLKVGNTWTYLATDLKSPQPKADPKRTIIEVEREEKFAYKESKDGKEIDKSLPGFLLKKTNGDKVQRDHVYVSEQGVFQAKVAGREITPPLLLVKFGLKFAGEKWNWDSTSGTTAVRGTCTVRSESVVVPFRKEGLTALVVLFTNNRTGDDRYEVETWYVHGVGMVKQRVRSKNHETLLELEKFERKGPGTK